MCLHPFEKQHANLEAPPWIIDCGFERKKDGWESRASPSGLLLLFTATRQNKGRGGERGLLATMSDGGGRRRVMLKVVVIGNSGVGKTTLMHRWVNDRFAQNYRSTIGCDFYTKTIDCGEDGDEKQPVSMQIWDTAGGERFKSLGRAFYRGVDVCILAYTQGDLGAWDGVEQWRKEMMEHNNGLYNFVVVETKNDLNKDIQVSEKLRKKAKSYCEQLEFPFFSTSSKNDIGVDQAFRCAAKGMSFFY